MADEQESRAGSGAGRAVVLRHERGASGPGLRLLAGRQGQLRRRPGGRRAGDRGQPGHRARRPGEPGVPGPGGALPGRRAGIRQFLDIGTGIPDREQHPRGRPGVAPDARIVYVDNDPIVLAHARALLTSTREGATDYIDADLREHATRSSTAAAQTLDFSRRSRSCCSAMLHLIPDEEDPYGIVAR